jgi:outer membrane protein OmpA-like peptidoglycan-associated protein
MSLLSPKFRLIFICLFYLLSNTSWAQNTPQNIHIRGVSIDISNNRGIKSNIYWSFAVNSSLAWSSAISTDADGKFELFLKNKPIKLKIEAQGYNSIIIDLALNILTEPEFFCKIPLLKLTEHQTNKVFSQSTTKSGKTQKNLEKELGRYAEIEFVAVNGVTSEPIGAIFKFVSTHSTKIENYQTHITKPSFNLKFTNNDIYAVEISAPSFQTFLGNLIIDDLNNRSFKDTIYLAKELAFLNVLVKNRDTQTGVFISKNASKNTSAIHKLSVNNNLYYETLEKNEWYKLQIIRSINDTVSHVFQATESIHTFDAEISPQVINSIVEENKKTILYFELGDFRLKPESQILLKQIIAQAKSQNHLFIDIYAYTDNVGDYHTNMYLSEIRAMFIKNAFYAEGITDKRIKCTAMGSKNPITNNNDELSRSQNRRVEIFIYNSQKK